MRYAVYIISVGIVFVSSLNTLYGRSTVTYESSNKILEARSKIEDLLGQMDRDGYYFQKKTMGFSYLIVNRFLSPFSYKIYIGAISSKIPMTIIRLEGNRGDIEMLTEMQRQDLIIKTYKLIPENTSPVYLSEKSHLAAQGLNLIAPWLAIPYCAYRSPRLAFSQAWMRSLVYLIIDMIVISAGGTNLYREGFQPGKYSGVIAAGLILNRILGSIQNTNLIRGHNRVSRLKYTFYLD